MKLCFSFFVSSKASKLGREWDDNEEIIHEFRVELSIHVNRAILSLASTQQSCTRQHIKKGTQIWIS